MKEIEKIERIREALKNAMAHLGCANPEVEYGGKTALNYALNIINIYFPEGEQSDGK